MTQESKIGYDITPNGICIRFVQPNGSVIELPEEINGIPITAIGDYAFCAEKQPSAVHTLTLPADGAPCRSIHIPESVFSIGEGAFCALDTLQFLHLPDQLECISSRMLEGCSLLAQLTLPKHLHTIGSYAFYNCLHLKELTLPETLHTIGSYAFYNCRALANINLPKAAEEIGTGIFLNCDSLYRIHFGRCRYLMNLISDLNHTLLLEVEMQRQDGSPVTVRLPLPDFQYEYIEDTPARQFHCVNYGSGHIYRQCISNSEIDFRRYDALFYLAQREDSTESAIEMALCRIESDFRLEPARKEAYLSYLRAHLNETAKLIFAADDRDRLQLLADTKLIDANTITPLLDLANAMQKAQAVSFLLDYQYRFLPKQKKTFPL